MKRGDVVIVPFPFENKHGNRGQESRFGENRLL